MRQNPSWVRQHTVLRAVAAAVALGLLGARAANVTLNASDAINTTSFNTGLNWSDATAPSAANDYFTGTFALRSLPTGGATFAGNSLSLDTGGVFAMKSATLHTINNFILNGGTINNSGFGGTGTETGLIGGAMNAAATSTFQVGGGGGSNLRNLNISATIGGTAGITVNKIGALTGETLTLSGTVANTFAGVTTVNNGATLILAKTAGVNAVGGNIVLNNNSTLNRTTANQIPDGASITVNGTGVISGTAAETVGAITINSTALNNLSNFTVTGATSITAGTTHDINSNTSFTTGSLSMSGGSVVRLGANSAATTVTIGSGGLTFNSGTIQLGQPGAAFNALVNLSGNITSDGTSAITNPNTTGARLLDLQAATRTIAVNSGTLGINPTVQNGGITKTGGGTLTLSGPNTYAGGTTVNAGVLIASNASALGAGAVTVNAGDLRIANVAVTANNLTLNNGATLSGTGAGASFSRSGYPSIATGATVLFSAPGAATDVLSIGSAIRNGDGSTVINVTGPGTVALNSGATASDAYHGSWNVQSGTLAVGDVNGLGNPGSGVTTGPRPVTLAGGALDFRVLGGANYANNVTVTGNASINPNRTVASPGAGASHTLGTLSIGGQTLGVQSGSNITSGTGGIVFTGTTITGNPTFNVVNGTGATTFTPGPITESGGTRSITKSGTGTLILSSNNSYGGTTTLGASGGVVQVGASGVTGSLGAGAVSIGSGSTLRLQRSDTWTFANDISGAGTLYIGSTTASVETDHVNLTGDNSGFTGNVAVNMGGIRINDSNGLGAGAKTVTMTAGTAGNPHLRLNGSGGAINLPASISFSTSNNTNNGTIINESGNNSIAGNFQMTAGGGDTVFNLLGGSLLLSGTFNPTATDRNLRVRGSGNVTVSGPISHQNLSAVTQNNTGVVMDGTGILTLSNAGNTYNGNTQINNGTLRLGAANVIPSGSGKGNVTINPASGTATFDLNGFSDTINALTRSGAGFAVVDNTAAGAATLTIGDNASTFTWDGTIQDTGGNLTLTKTGGGRVTLSSANTFQGNILTPNANSNHGQLRIAHPNALGVGPKVVRQQTNQSGAVASLELFGGITTASNIDLEAAGHGTANTSPHLDNVSGNNTWGGRYRIWSTGGSYYVKSSEAGSTLTIGGGVDNGIVNTRTIFFYGAGDGVIAGPITQTGGGALSLDFSQTTGFDPGTWTITSTGNTYTGRTLVRKTDTLFGNPTLVIPTGNESTLGAPAPAANALELDGGILRVTTNSLVLNDTGRNMTVGVNGATLVVDPGLSLTFANTLTASGTSLTKQGAGTLNLTGTTSAGQLNLNAGLTDISGGTLRVNSLNFAGGAFNWGSGRLTVESVTGASGVIDYSDPTYYQVRVGTQMTANGNLTAGAGAVLQAHGSPTFYINNGVRFNNYNISGILDLSAGGDTLAVEIRPFFLRPFSPALGAGASDFGSVPLVLASQILGTFSTFGTVFNDGLGFTEFTGAFTSAAALPTNTWYLEYADTNADLQVDTVFFHYKVSGYVPEPDTFAMGLAGVMALRLLRRFRFTSGPADTAPARRERRRRRALPGITGPRTDW